MNMLQQLQEDLDRAAPVSRARRRPGSVHRDGEHGATAQGRFSRPLYDTGEHVLAGEDLPDMDVFDDVTRAFLERYSYGVGTPDASGKRVEFAYGEIIAMADLFADFDQMDAASHAELSRIRTLIRKSRDHYNRRVRGKKAGADPVSTKQWQDATSERYLDLAIENFAHFAPSDPAIATPDGSGTISNFESVWQTYNQSAMATVRADPTDQGLERALAINAFGDHYLTDAFSAGHLFNKHDVATLFKSRIVDGSGKINTAGESFFEAVAKASFKGELKKTFSDHETVKRKWGVWRPNINSASRFAKFLMAIQEAEPDLIGKTLVAKIVHDDLNHHGGGVPVENRVGDSWKLTGDGTLNLKNLTMVGKAVSRSIYNVTNEADQGLSADALFDRVWDLAPTPTDASRKLIAKLVRTYTDPGNAKLRKAAGALIRKNYHSLLDEAKERGALKHA